MQDTSSVQNGMACGIVKSGALYTWGRIGFDGIVEVSAAGRGFSLASLKNERLKINANNDNYALAAA